MSEDIGFGARFGIASLATWRVTHLLAEEDGPADLVIRLRARLGSSHAGDLMDCFYCLSVWVAAPLSLTVVKSRREAPIAWLALSGAACLIERFVGAPDTVDAGGFEPAGEDLAAAPLLRMDRA